MTSTKSFIPKVVFDTNIFISAIIFGGAPKICLELVKNKEVILYTSNYILFELAKTLHTKFSWTDKDITEVLEGISQFTITVKPTVKVDSIKTDTSDNHVLEAALESNADYIISGDKKHLLSLNSFQEIPIISASEFIIKCRI